MVSFIANWVSLRVSSVNKNTFVVAHIIDALIFGHYSSYKTYCTWDCNLKTGGKQQFPPLEMPQICTGKQDVVCHLRLPSHTTDTLSGIHVSVSKLVRCPASAARGRQIRWKTCIFTDVQGHQSCFQHEKVWLQESWFNCLLMTQIYWLCLCRLHLDKWTILFTYILTQGFSCSVSCTF